MAVPVGKCLENLLQGAVGVFCLIAVGNLVYPVAQSLLAKGILEGRQRFLDLVAIGFAHQTADIQRVASTSLVTGDATGFFQTFLERIAEWQPVQLALFQCHQGLPQFLQGQIIALLF